MNLTSPSQVKAWCIDNDFHPNRTLGQNFLVDRNALVAIVDAGLGAGPTPGARVLEVGPGLGVLTEEMLRPWIGLRTNIKNITNAEFDAIMRKRTNR